MSRLRNGLGEIRHGAGRPYRSCHQKTLGEAFASPDGCLAVTYFFFLALFFAAFFLVAMVSILPSILDGNQQRSSVAVN